MFSSHEEQTLRRLVAEHTPLPKPITDLGKVHNPATGDYLTRELARCKPIQSVNPEEDYATINKLRDAGVLKKGEKVMEFFARTGLGRAQLLSMNKMEIQDFVLQAEANNATDGIQPPKAFAEVRLQPAPRQEPSAILI
jgi:hypothetical protein